ncbi:MAG: uracil-DNA glycosylase [Planctomycetes bacterium]|nr:uracil-DNA glycosylase [Planctomycetota bacterium]
MDNPSSSFRVAFRQQLLSDRMMGVRSVPMPPLRQRDPAVQSKLGISERPGALPAPRPARSKEAAAAKAEQLRVLDETRVKGCVQCSLCKTRTQTVFGQGNPDARLVFVGEAPGFEEDKQGLAFIGPAGQLLSRMIVAMHLTRDDVFICNILKCRPPNNRDPSADEILSCSPYLMEQLAIIGPEVLVTLGAPASKTLLNTTASIGKLRGRFHDCYPSGIAGQGPSIPLMPTYHPAYLLRSPGEKRKTWEDLQLVMDRLGLR